MPTIQPISAKVPEVDPQESRVQRADPLAFRGTYAVAGKKDPAQQFEAFVLQSFVQEMLPKDADTVYGGGLAGDYWRSMMAERLGEVMAETGAIGIADLVRDQVKLKQSQMQQFGGSSGLTAAALSAAGASETDASAISVLAGSSTDGE